MATRNETGAERYLRQRLRDPEYRDDYDRDRRRIDMVDRFIRAVDEQREALGLTKADLARRAGMKPEAVRRLLSAEHPNPTLNTLVVLADVLGLELTLRPEPPRARARPVVTPARSGASGTRSRSA